MKAGFVFNTLARFGVAAALLPATTALASAETSGTPQPTVAQAEPQATPTPKPRWIVRGTIKAYDFTRQNAWNSYQDKANTQINQQSFALGIAPHVEYNYSDKWTAGATYWFVSPLNGCTNPYSHETPPCKYVVPAGGTAPGSALNPDDTLPGYQLAVLNEAYLQYQDTHVFAKGGNQVLNLPWAPSSAGFEGSRIMPSSYQSFDGIYTFNKNWQFEVGDIWKFLPRTESFFTQTTLLTRVVAPYGSEGYGGIGPNIYNPTLKNIITPGVTFGRVGYTSSGLTANLSDYQWYNLLNLLWVDARYNVPALPGHPYVQFQGGHESSTGLAVAGTVDSNVVGLLGGVNVIHNLLFTASFDYVPTRTTSLVLPTGFTCNPTNHTITVKTANKYPGLNYFLPNAGTPNCNTVNGVTTLSYGGCGSPYTDDYATDPFFTTSLTQGMVDRRSPGTAYLVRLTGTLLARHLVTYASFAGYDYNQPYMAAPTYEFDYDLLYYFNPPPPPGGYYRGFSFRYRYGDRTQPFYNPVIANLQAFPALPEFKYNRFQAEYDF